MRVVVRPQQGAHALGGRHGKERRHGHAAGVRHDVDGVDVQRVQEGREHRGLRGGIERLARSGRRRQQALNAGPVDEFHLAVAPALLHAGLRVFERVERDRLRFEPAETTASPRVTHLRYRVARG